MDGLTLLRALRQDMAESSTSTWPDVRTSYDYLYKAAIATANRSGVLTGSTDITTIASRAYYPLPPEYLRLYLMNDQNQYFIKYDDGDAEHFINFVEYDSVVLANLTTGVPVSQEFSIRTTSAPTAITGSATSTATFTTGTGYTIFGQSLGEAVLTDSATTLSTVTAGDIIHNLTDGSHGVVVAYTSAHVVVCALFDGTLNYFTSGDTYVIWPQTTYEIYLNPPPLYASDTVTVQYIQSPSPVYSAFRNYPFHRSLTDPMVDYAHWLYKYRDEKPEFGNILYQKWLMGIKEGGNMVNQAKQRHRGYKVNLIKRADRSFTYRR